jgi:hypothetical protein
MLRDIAQQTQGLKRQQANQVDFVFDPPFDGAKPPTDRPRYAVVMNKSNRPIRSVFCRHSRRHWEESRYVGSLVSGLLTWSGIWCDVENSKSFRSSRHCRVFPGHRLKGASALHNSLASIFTAPGMTTWSDMSGNARKNQVTWLVTLRHRSTMSGALGYGAVLGAFA